MIEYASYTKEDLTKLKLIQHATENELLSMMKNGLVVDQLRFATLSNAYAPKFLLTALIIHSVSARTIFYFNSTLLHSDLSSEL